MIKKATISILLCLAFPTLIFGQGETSNWYFGNGAGISFNNDGTVNTETNGQLNTAEGCATISDSAGNLLFYTDGIVVYNRDHVIMENGTELYGDPSSTQSAIIAPKPDATNVFYIFTVDTSLSKTEADNGLNYSIVDLNVNGGRGAVLEKNIPLLAHSSEKLAAVVKNCRDQSIWLLTLASSDGSKNDFDTYHAFEINDSGVSPTSIKSTFEDLSISEPRGYLKISSDGTRLASANMAQGLYVYDFDLDTGIVSNQKQLSISGSNKAAYGLEFSPNGRFLYAHASKDAKEENGHSSTLLQFDLEASNISGSQTILDDRSIFRGALQLGANGKIYRTIAKSFSEGTSFLGVINRPNELGKDSRYKHDAVSLGSKNGMQGLPPFVQSFLNRTDLITDADGNSSNTLSLCFGEGFKLEAEDISEAIYEWEKDGIPITNTGNVFELSTTNFEDAGRYLVKVIPKNPLECPLIGEALVSVSPLPENTNLLLTQCDIDSDTNSDGITAFDLDQVNTVIDTEITFYESETDRANDNPISDSGNYMNIQPFNQTIFYRAITASGCAYSGEIDLEVHPTTVNTSTSSPLMGCDENVENGVLQTIFDLEEMAKNVYEGVDVNFYSNLDDLVLEENSILGDYTSGNTTIYVRLESDGQCLGVEKIDLIVNALPYFEFPGFYETCTDGVPLQLGAPSGFDSYAWYKIDENQILKVYDEVDLAITEGGTYSLEVGTTYEKDGQITTCTMSRDFIVIPSNKAVFQEIRIEDASNNNTVEISVTGDGDYEYSLDGLEYQNANIFENVDAGFITAFVRDKRGCGISEEEISVMGFPKFFTPNGDGFNDQWQLIGIDQNDTAASISIFNRLGKLMVRLNSNNPGWDGTFQGKRLPASDYWFKATFENGKEFNGHFSLKR